MVYRCTLQNNNNHRFAHGAEGGREEATAAPKIRAEQRKCGNGTQIWFDHISNYGIAMYGMQQRWILFEVCARCAYTISAIQSIGRCGRRRATIAFCQARWHTNTSCPSSGYAFGIPYSQQHHQPAASNIMSIYKIVIFFLLSRAHNCIVYTRSVNIAAPRRT